MRLLSFPAYETAIGTEISQALQGARDYAPDVMQLLYIANRYEHRTQIETEIARGTVLICDRYLASSVAYGEAQGLDPAWLVEMQKRLPQPDLTILLDIPPEVSAQRKTKARDRYERDLELLARVRESYHRQAAGEGWVTVDATRDREWITTEVLRAVSVLATI